MVDMVSPTTRKDVGRECVDGHWPGPEGFVNLLSLSRRGGPAYLLRKSPHGSLPTTPSQKGRQQPDLEAAVESERSAALASFVRLLDKFEPRSPTLSEGTWMNLRRYRLQRLALLASGSLGVSGLCAPVWRSAA